MVLRAQWPLGTIAQFFHFVAEEKTTGIPVIIEREMCSANKLTGEMVLILPGEEWMALFGYGTF